MNDDDLTRLTWKPQERQPLPEGATERTTDSGCRIITMPIRNETRTARRERHAAMLSTETGYTVQARPSCYTLWDEKLGYNWLPLYSHADVRRKARELDQRDGKKREPPENSEIS